MINLIHGDCLEEMKKLDANSVDSIVTDPPYGLSFMGKKWDYDVPSEEIWRECLRVLKPGGHLLAFAGTRTQHRMAVRIEDAGFEIRDMIAWIYGSGFPKSLNIGKSIDSKLTTGSAAKNGFHKLEGQRREGRIGMYDTVEEHGFRKTNPDQLGAFDHEPTTDAAKQWEGWGTALKPALEPITVARKPLIGTVAENVLKHGTGGINIDGCRVGTEGGRTVTYENQFAKWREMEGRTDIPKSVAGVVEHGGRFPANLIHDGSEEVLELFPHTKSGKAVVGTGKGYAENPSSYASPGQIASCYADEGSAARFFYCAKASKKDRGDNKHPTVKPTDLMRYLCRLVTPLGGTILDPFMGSGSTGKAAKLEGFGFIGIEREAEYVEIAKARINETL